jgi:hypothetical protein
MAECSVVRFKVSFGTSMSNTDGDKLDRDVFLLKSCPDLTCGVVFETDDVEAIDETELRRDPDSGVTDEAEEEMVFGDGRSAIVNRGGMDIATCLREKKKSVSFKLNRHETS